jgi:hypothetical protein
MKKEIIPEMEDELRAEYYFSQLLKGGVRGKYVERYQAGTNVVLLAPDVAEAFPTESARFFKGIFWMTINDLVNVIFIPSFPHEEENWSLNIADDVDDVRSPTAT